MGRTELGGSCTGALDCVDGLECVTDVEGQSVAGGVCTVQCAAIRDCPGDLLCATFGSRASSYCVERCSPGVGGTGKCHGRDDFACVSQEPPHTCRPSCSVHEQCPGGFCDLITGLCTSTEPTGAPLGAACTRREDCTGYCLNRSGDRMGFCSQSCVLDGIDACGPDGDCIWKSTENGGAGDLGACGQLCNCNDDCRRAGSVCRVANNPMKGFAGYCDWATRPGGAPPLPCGGSAGADGGP